MSEGVIPDTHRKDHQDNMDDTFKTNEIVHVSLPEHVILPETDNLDG